MVELLLLGQQHGYGGLDQACQEALRLGCSDAAAMSNLMTREERDRAVFPRLEVAALQSYERPLPEARIYDALLETEMV